MSYLIFKADTSGLPIRRDAPVTQLSNWPRIVKLTWLTVSSEGETLDRKERIVKPDGWVINKGAIRVHGISNIQARMNGTDIKEVLNEIKMDMKSATAMVAHNLEFSMKVLVSEFIRNNIDTNVNEIGKICTMRSGVEICKLPSSGEGYKYPKLNELHQELFDADNPEDLEGCKNCFFRLKELYNYT